ncbi:MarR family winged helix-turn-helix transcriptional regulator [Gryllotalpicola reticulitermitis]|uniref:MarR family winged helix-turn-helix transcriptional regulator n=1 Tax=Gryllotalpicola reticulitermitis TaxID=1184153 RepID=A0ABV8Q845_9MICO
MEPDAADEAREAWARIAPGVDTMPIEIVVRLLRSARLVERSGDARLAEFGLSRPELELLMLLRRRDELLSPSTITSELLFTAPGTSKRLKSLEERGLVTRVANPRDRRGALIGLTDAGSALVDEAFPANVEAERELLAGLPVPQRERVARALRELLRALEQR